MEEKSQKANLSIGIVLKTLVIVLGLGFLFLVRDIVMLLFISIIITASIDPTINYLEKKKISRSVGTLLIYLGIFSALSLVVYFLIPSVSSQIQEFSKNLNYYFGTPEERALVMPKLSQSEGINVAIENAISEVGDFLSSISHNIFSKTVGIFSGLISVIVVFSMAFYMAMEKDGIKKFFVSITPEKKKNYVANLTQRIKEKIGKWLVGQFILMFIIFLLTFLGLSIIGIPYALTLAIFAGILEIVPYIGPIISAIPALLVGFSISPTVGILVLLLYITIQQFENHIIVPQIMKRAVGLNPVATIVAILIGFKLAGVLGAFVSVPIATAVSLFVSDLMSEKN